MRAGQAGEGSPPASTVLEVADGIRGRDAHLSSALVEHAVRLGGGDPAVRRAARLSAARSLAELDRPTELLTRFAAQLADADDRGRAQDAVGWRCLVAGAALDVGSPAAARTVLADASDADAPEWCVPVLAVLRARERAAAGDVVGCDAAARAVGSRVPRTVALDLLRARAAARIAAADPDGALGLFVAGDVAGTDDDTETDGGRRAAQVAADHVAVLLDRDDRHAALERAAPFLCRAPGPSATVAVARLAVDVARRVHLPVGETERALALLSRAEHDLAARRLPGPAGCAGFALAEAAEAAGDLRRALAALRRAHAHEARARDADHAARDFLSAVLVRTARGRPASGPEDPATGAITLRPAAAGTAGSGDAEAPETGPSRGFPESGPGEQAVAAVHPELEGVAARACRGGPAPTPREATPTKSVPATGTMSAAGTVSAAGTTSVPTGDLGHSSAEDAGPPHRRDHIAGRHGDGEHGEGEHGDTAAPPGSTTPDGGRGQARHGRPDAEDGAPPPKADRAGRTSADRRGSAGSGHGAASAGTWGGLGARGNGRGWAATSPERQAPGGRGSRDVDAAAPGSGGHAAEDVDVGRRRSTVGGTAAVGDSCAESSRRGATRLEELLAPAASDGGTDTTALAGPHGAPGAGGRTWPELASSAGSAGGELPPTPADGFGTVDGSAEAPSAPAPRTPDGRAHPVVESGGTEVDVTVSRGIPDTEGTGVPGARLADLLAEAMAAFREVGRAPEESGPGRAGPARGTAP